MPSPLTIADSIDSRQNIVHPHLSTVQTRAIASATEQIRRFKCPVPGLEIFPVMRDTFS
jgi:hypothetical protein